MRVIIWKSLSETEKFIDFILREEQVGNISVTGISSMKGKDEEYFGYEYIQPEYIKDMEFDYIVTTSNIEFIRDLHTLGKLGIDKKKVINGSVFAIENFDFNKYIRIKKSNITILSNNGWGGIVYKRLGLKYNSPFINCFQEEKDFIKYLNSLETYVKKAVTLYSWEKEPVFKREFPVLLLEDIKIYCNHDIFYEEAESKWNNRSKRININNMLIVMHTHNRDILEEFDKLPFENKICFVPFQSELKSAFYISEEALRKNKIENFDQFILDMARGKHSVYNIFDILDIKKKEYEVCII